MEDSLEASSWQSKAIRLDTTEAANGRATFALVNVRSLSFTLRDTDIQCEQMPV